MVAMLARAAALLLVFASPCPALRITMSQHSGGARQRHRMMNKKNAMSRIDKAVYAFLLFTFLYVGGHLCLALYHGRL